MLTKKNDSFNRNILLEMQIMLNVQSANLVHGRFFHVKHQVCSSARIHSDIHID